MGYADWPELLADLSQHRGEVSRQFENIALRQGDDGEDKTARKFAELWETGASVDDWSQAFAAGGFTDSAVLADAISTFARERATRSVDSISLQRLEQFVPSLLSMLRDSEQPGLALQRALAIVSQVLRRSAYIALLNENTAALQRLVDLCSKSAYVAGQIARHPMLLDELLDPRIFGEPVSRGELEADLEQRLPAAGDLDSEQLVDLLSQFQRSRLFRIAVADFNGNLPIMRVSDSLTDLAETVLDRALEIAWQDMTEKHGVPRYAVDKEMRKAGFGIIAYGKFGGIELSYGSDLDLVFLHDSHGSQQETDGSKPLDNAVFFTRLVRRLVHYLTAQTASGMLYEVDTRLRPDGKSGVLVTSVDAFERYQEANAWTWEHQALLRARPVAGSPLIAREFERIRAETLIARVRRDKLRADVVSMRQRMREQLDRSDGQQFDLKQGQGGIADIEFIVQFLVLANAADHRAVIHYPDNIRQLGTLAAAGCVTEAEATELQEIYRRYRRRLHHLALDEQAPVVETSAFADERRTVIATWNRYLGA
jgi:glutamate-ammonia-ligase adenylyltransferase